MIDIESIKLKIIEKALKGQIKDSFIVDDTAFECFELLNNSINSLRKKKDNTLSMVRTEEQFFEIPESWLWVRVGNVFQHNTGKALNASDTEGKQFEYITTSNLYWDTFELDHLRVMKFKDSEIEKCTVRKGDLLICEGGDVGRAAIWDKDYEMKIQNHIHKLRPYADVCVKFFYYVFFYYKRTGKIDGRGIGLQGLSSKTLHQLPVPLPSIKSQFAIAEKIDEAFLLLSTLEELQLQYDNDLEVLKSKIIDAGIQGKLTEQLLEDGDAEELFAQIQKEKAELISNGTIKKGKPLPEIDRDEIPFDIPGNWKWVRMLDVLDVRDGTHDSPKYHKTGIPMITSKNLSSGKLDYENIKYVSLEDAKKINERSAVDKGDILFAMIGTIGNPVLIKDNVDFVVKNVALFKPYNNSINMKYIYCYLMREQYAFRRSVSGGLQPFISLKQFRTHVMPLPPLAEQQRIVEKIDAIMQIVN